MLYQLSYDPLISPNLPHRSPRTDSAETAVDHRRLKANEE
ncbi:hypothetical protein SLNWT_4555 [Streptomyces albus]|uniref:Uncharacterized protein n=1 Tax=Streptomyces albus (strain ATCC 21838 / DSM 41398 / FERM P-419 / JCM 4703 / NBRC 107858) TaxID=1081613 RepID=A0A0B5F236_STRA4|nr:hypothetical protein SLNWT_4555 [Streptomyces albus]AOU79236.1 hypothetical protein SLNHY_4545 [Streptomyces albus]